MRFVHDSHVRLGSRPAGEKARGFGVVRKVQEILASMAAIAAIFALFACGARSGLRFEPTDAGPLEETCSNGLDDDGDGLVDEACPCPAGLTQVCYGGADGSEGVGICRAGVQACVETLGVLEWGECEREVRPAREACIGGLDEDCDGTLDCDDADCARDEACVSLPPDDCTPHCPSETCDGRDNTGDGRVDEGRVCDGIEGPCPAAGAIRICDAYCGIHQRCRLDGTWGPCVVDGMGPVPECDEHADCPHGYMCDVGSCVQSVDCRSDDECDYYFGDGGFCTEQGFCVSECFHHDDCPVPLVCDLGLCVPDPYHP